MTDETEKTEKTEKTAARGKPRRLGQVRTAWRFLTDPSESVLTKLFLVAALVYVVVPLDAIPDMAPLVGWLDDLGFFALATALLGRALRRYQKTSEQRAQERSEEPAFSGRGADTVPTASS